ncbi:succinylglutamate desuccinylase/aspartoacylase family protein [Bradyrhizobium sp. 180]|uniref:succinylglutamate desuccinylase/aspartoacylase domain-containing protein n=1 Tax=Bradyrhizobium sp. 180 TaxID=2782650 RepID=UPI001FF94801|nr:succinylglutamate desuccinylase/aspartoacylase family protein [Bradyrhizobium sp. 180]MCK1492117.1 succinylglutamate desuccinylase/aspartoacylase family protein [Bradyrhizobium sp. 180]
MSSAKRDQKQQILEYPVEIAAPDIGPWCNGNIGIPYVHRLEAAAPGPHLLLTALVHGNEPCGAIALDRLLTGGFRPSRGCVTLAFVNVDAYAKFTPSDPRASRWVDEDMNRVWAPEILAQRPSRSADVHRAAELLPLLKEADFLLDLHSTQHPNEPLVLAGPLEKSRKLARSVGLADLVVIDKGHAQGPRMRDFGEFNDPSSTRIALLLECGQHWAASSADVAYAACLRIFDRFSMLPSGYVSGRVVALPEEATRFVEITMPVTIKNEFVFALPLRGGEIIKDAGTLVGYDGSEPVVTPHDNCIAIMPSQRLWAGLTAVRLGRLVAVPGAASLPPA